MPLEAVLYGAADGIATITLNRPERLNALTAQLFDDLHQSLAAAEADISVRVVILAGAGRAFCAGADLAEIGAGDHRLAEGEQKLCKQIVTLSKPVIAAVHGHAVGAGAELAIACDFIVMAAHATLSLPEARIGAYFGGGVTALLPRLIGLAKARELLMLGLRVDAREALQLGLAARVFQDEAFPNGARDFAAQVAASAPLTLALLKKHLSASAETSFDATLKAELSSMIATGATADIQEGIAALSEKRTPKFKGA